ncbi:arylsulfatase A family protein [Shewanella psychrophila]|uniref:Arylsulfatase A family protein n=1 Tax=Shewanella psychrophila TaxID=225848 RepID=A0A1S6HUG3_9GAMM|nr:sulfatase-like hydrolase/transferase [Shewanella psychrophila]AQS39134.1 arylsulfatase A family protein [Shewanella psychrophila]
MKFKKSLITTLVGMSLLGGNIALAEEQPNLVIFYVDDLGYGDLANYGHPILKTPNIDKLAAAGIKYTQYYSPAPLCSPSRAGMLTGRTPYRTGIRSWIPHGKNIHLGENEITIANILQDKGYDTAIMGKVHLNGGIEMKDHPQVDDMGFEYSFIIPGAFADNQKVKNAKPQNGFRNGKLYPDNFWRNGKAVGTTSKFSAELVTDEVVGYLDKQKGKQPFFLYIPYSEVHTPIASPDRILNMYSDYRSDFAKKNPDAFYFDWKNLPYRGQGEYYANVTFMDEQLGRVVDKIKQMGEEDNTIIIFTSDNGPVTREARKPWELNMAGETGGFRGRKDNLLEGGIRVPAIFKYKSIEAGQISNEPVYGLDILPTLSQLMHFDLPSDRTLDGQSIVPTFSGKTLERKKPMIWTIDMPFQDDAVNEWAIRDGDWKLILDRDEQPKYLFNLKDDKYEVWNQVGKQDEIQKSLMEKFEAYKKDIETDSIMEKRKS